MRTFSFVLAAALSLGAAAHAEPVLDFLYVEANEGDSSGGHAALRLGDEVFHFQYQPGSLLRLERAEWPHFQHVYGRLGNRRIHVRRVAATPGSAALLRDGFATRLLEEEAQVRWRDALERDRALLEALSDERGRGRELATAALPVEAAGYFTGSQGGVEPRLAALRARLARRDGAARLPRRIAEAERAIEGLRPVAAPEDWLARVEAAPLALPRTFSQRVELALARLRALQIVAEAPGLAADGVHAPEDETFRLDANELHALERQADRLAARLAELVASARPDAGRTLLVGLARLAALSRSLESGRLVFLDAFPSGATSVDAKRVAARPDVVTALQNEARAALATARHALVSSEEPEEAELAALESAANRLYELEAAPREGRALRLASAPLLPSRSAPLVAPPLPRLARAEAESALARAARDAAQLSARFRATHRYDLLTRNCVTELFRGIDAVFARAGEDPLTASRAHLGGWVDAAAFAHFIPFVADAAVADAWRLEETRVLPSERDARVAAMKQDEPALLVELRESNTLTSSVYRLHGDDSFFLFFSDGAVLPRPLLGALNLAAGIGQAALGLPLAPFDAGRTLASGAAGALFSLPELFFVSVRKGTLDFVAAGPSAER